MRQEEEVIIRVKAKGGRGHGPIPKEGLTSQNLSVSDATRPAISRRIVPTRGAMVEVRPFKLPRRPMMMVMRVREHWRLQVGIRRRVGSWTWEALITFVRRRNILRL